MQIQTNVQPSSARIAAHSSLKETAQNAPADADSVALGWALNYVPAEKRPNFVQRNTVAAVGTTLAAFGAHQLASFLGASPVGAAAAGLAALALGGAAGAYAHQQAKSELLGHGREVVAGQRELKARLLRDNGGEGAATHEFEHASVSQWDNKALLDFKKSGRLVMIDGMGPKADLIRVPESMAGEWLLEVNKGVGNTNLATYNPDGSVVPGLLGQSSPRNRKARLDADSGKLEINQQVYDLNNATLTSPTITFEKGAITKANFPREQYLNTLELKGEGQVSYGSYFMAPEISPETFGYKAELTRDPREGTVETVKQSLLNDQGVFASATIERELRYPVSSENTRIVDLEPKQVGGQTEVRFKNGAQLLETWSEDGPTLRLNGKTLPNTRLGDITDHKVEVLFEEFHDKEGVHRKTETRQIVNPDGSVTAYQKNWSRLWGHGQYDYQASWTPGEGVDAIHHITYTAAPNERAGKDKIRLDDSGQIHYTDAYNRNIDALKFPVDPRALG